MPAVTPAMTSAELRKLLEKNGVSQRELARRLGVDGQTVHRWCAGSRPVDKFKAAAIRSALAQ